MKQENRTGTEWILLGKIRCRTEIECILKSKFELPFGSWIQAEFILAEERLRETILE